MSYVWIHDDKRKKTNHQIKKNETKLLKIGEICKEEKVSIEEAIKIYNERRKRLER